MAYRFNKKSEYKVVNVFTLHFDLILDQSAYLRIHLTWLTPRHTNYRETKQSLHFVQYVRDVRLHVEFPPSYKIFIG